MYTIHNFLRAAIKDMPPEMHGETPDVRVIHINTRYTVSHSEVLKENCYKAKCQIESRRDHTGR